MEEILIDSEFLYKVVNVDDDDDTQNAIWDEICSDFEAYVKEYHPHIDVRYEWTTIDIRVSSIFVDNLKNIEKNYGYENWEVNKFMYIYTNYPNVFEFMYRSAEGCLIYNNTYDNFLILLTNGYLNVPIWGRTMLDRILPEVLRDGDISTIMKILAHRDHFYNEVSLHVFGISRELREKIKAHPDYEPDIEFLEVFDTLDSFDTQARFDDEDWYIVDTYGTSVIYYSSDLIRFNKLYKKGTIYLYNIHNKYRHDKKMEFTQNEDGNLHFELYNGKRIY